MKIIKKITILFSVFLLVGCNVTLSNQLDINSALNTVLKEEITNYNTHGKWFKYYKPRDFSIIEYKDYNHTIMNDGNKYYLSIDIHNYYNKKDNDYKKDSSLYYSSSITFNDKNGFIEIRDGNNGYFYIKMMYNYSYIEVCVEEKEIANAIINSTIILSSIKYNDSVIENFINSGDLSNTESTYEIKKPIKTDENKNILGV